MNSSMFTFTALLSDYYCKHTFYQSDEEIDAIRKLTQIFNMRLSLNYCKLKWDSLRIFKRLCIGAKTLQ